MSFSMSQHEVETKVNKLLPKYKKARFVHNGRSLETGIDCLGFIILFYKEFGIHIPNDDGRVIEEDWFKKEPDRYVNALKRIDAPSVAVSDLQALDMVYFAISRNIITHTGIMINNKEFAHMSPKSGFLISKLERGWLRRARGAMRVIETI